MKFMVDFYVFLGTMMPFFPEKVDNVTVQIGQSAELRCKVENLNNYKVKFVLFSFPWKKSAYKFTESKLVNRSTSMIYFRALHYQP